MKYNDCAIKTIVSNVFKGKNEFSLQATFPQDLCI